MYGLINSNLLYTREDGNQDFVHDTLKSFFASQKIKGMLEDGSLDFVELHKRIGFKGRETVTQRYKKMFSFLKEVFGDDYNPSVLDGILSDEDIAVTTDVGDHYGLGPKSKLLIRIKDDSYCNYKGQMAIAKLAEHLCTKHGVSLICVEGADGEVDTKWFRAFPDAEIRRDVAKYFVKKGEVTGIEFLSITIDNPIVLYGAETRDLYKKEFSSAVKDDEKKSDADRKKESSAHSQRTSVLVANTIEAMEKYGQDIAILVYGGGFIYDINLSPLIEKGISYAFLNPKERGMNWELHRKVLRNEKTSLEDIIMDGVSFPADENQK